jgi:hypothetical protein
VRNCGFSRDFAAVAAQKIGHSPRVCNFVRSFSQLKLNRHAIERFAAKDRREPIFPRPAVAIDRFVDGVCDCIGADPDRRTDPEPGPVGHSAGNADQIQGR